MKNPGESVRANEAVVEMGNLNRLAADGYVPIEYAYRVKVGQVVEIQPRTRSRIPLPVEKKRFRGKITFVDPEIQPDRSRIQSASAPSSTTPAGSSGPASTSR